MQIRYVAPPNPDIDLRGVTELRVHGVGGTMPEDLLDDPHPVQVSGDRLAGFYRTRDVDGRHVEAYSWGGLTSRSALRVLWLLLLPFTLANLAGWMQRGTFVGDGWRRVFQMLVRLVGLSLTLSYVLWTFGITGDLLAYQCGGQPTCASRHWWLSLLAWPLFAGYPGRRLVVGAAACAAMIALLALLARTTRQRYEHYEPDGDHTAASAEDVRRAYDMGLESPQFWRGEPLVMRLSRAHIAGALGLLTALLAATATAVHGPETLLGLVAVAGVVTVALSAAAALAPASAPGGWTRALVRAAPALLAAAAMVVWRQPGTASPAVPGRLPGLLEFAGVLVGVHILLLVALGAFLLAATPPSRMSAPARVFRWGGPLIALTLATLALDSFFAGAAVRVADVLGVPVPGNTRVVVGQGPFLVYPQLYDVFAGAFTLVLLAAAVGAGGWWLLVWQPQIRRQSEQIAAEYAADAPPSVREEQAWRRRIARTRCLSQAVDAADFVLTTVMLLALGLAAAALVALLDGGRLALPRGGWSVLWTWCTWVVSIIPLVAVALMRWAHSNPELRRRVAILWDVGTFWPRAYHPLAPPSYAERAVPDLRRRVERIVQAGGRVIVSAHSQGTVLAAAALLQLDFKVRSELALVTYGCPLTRLYARVFPAYFGGDVLPGLRDSLRTAASGGMARWRNFYRRTDLIGGAVFAPDDPDDVLLADPATSTVVPGEPWPAVLGHSGYLHDATMLGFLRKLAALLADERPTAAPSVRR